MKKLKLLGILLVLPVFSYSQNDIGEYYRLSKEGEKYLKPIKYVLLDENGRKITNGSTIISFIIGSEIFKYKRGRHELDTLNTSDLKTIPFKSIKELKDEELEEHKKRTRQEGIDMPPPFNHYNLKVFLIEKICSEKFLRYEVDWIYAIP